MNIRRATRPNTYTNIDNQLINDPRLSAAALGVLIYLLSKPDNWTANKKELEKRFKTSRNKLSTNGLDNCFKEMRDAGYAELKPVMKKNKEGKMYFCGSEYLIFDNSCIPIEDITEAEDSPTSENVPSPEDSPTPENTRPRKSSGVNIITTDIKVINTNSNNAQIPSFDDFWNSYNYKKSKKQSERAWKRLSDKKKVTAFAAIPSYLAYLQKTGFSQCHASTWLNNERWTDDNSIAEQPDQTPKNLVIDYAAHMKANLPEKRFKAMNGKIGKWDAQAKQKGMIEQISALKSKLSHITNPTYTNELVFDFCFGSMSNLGNVGTTPERAISKFKQFYNTLSGFKQNKSNLRAEYYNHLTR